MKKLLLLSMFLFFGCKQFAWSKTEGREIIQEDTETTVNAKRTDTLTLYKSEEYRELEQKVDIARKNAAKFPGNQDLLKELQQAEQNLENFKSEATRLHQGINKIPLISERGTKAKQFFEDGDFKAAREILNAKEMSREQQALLKRRQQLAKQHETITTQLNGLAGEFMLKALLTAIEYQLGDRRIPLTNKYFEQALASNRTPERLYEYALFLQKNNQFLEAEKPYQEALNAYRELAANNPAVYLPYVAGTLNHLGNVISDDSRRHEEAKKRFQEALKIYRELVEKNPAVYLPYVAGTLNHLGSLISDDNRRREKAEKRYQEALEAYHELAENNPAVYLPYVAGTLNNLATLVAADSHRSKEAEKYFQEALKIYRQLAKNYPAQYLPNVANTLNNLGNLVSDVDSSRREEAEKRYQEAIKAYRELTETNPAVYLPYAANTLNNLATLVATDSRRRGDAEKRYQEALKAYRELANNDPAAYLPYVAGTLNNLATLIAADSHRSRDAEKRYQEALKAYRELATINPALYLPYVAGTLNNLATLVIADSRRHKEAEKYYQEALKTYRELAKNNPAVYLPYVANTLGAYGFAHLKWRQSKEAKTYLYEAEEIFIKLAAQAPQDFEGNLNLIKQLLRQAN